ncbi:MAG TPA: homocysteine S-methyltransferase [Nocardioidaceae bacterium]|nr:homocysteine S-methyltransferase [Nocardioidaceae bacterium]
MRQNLVDAIAGQVVVLDGGLATQLEAQGADLSSALWSARLLRDDPAQIVEAHRRFFEAGADVAITASYQASFDGLASAGVDAADAERLMRRSVELARDAVASASGDSPRWVAASVGPYGAALADGSEYHGRYGLSVAELRTWHRRRLDVLTDAEPDVLAIETVPCLAEAEALVAEIAGSGRACWLSLSCSDGRTRAGEDPDEAFSMARDVDEVIAVGVNCTDPTEIVELVERAAAVSGKPVVAYPNSGEGWDAVRRVWVGGSTFVPERVTAWVDGGARLVGGCCRVGPDQIAELRAQALSVAPARRPD